MITFVVYKIMIILMEKRFFYILIILCLFSIKGFGQLSGTVKDVNDEILPFATIYIKNTTQGTTTNVEGKYTLELAPGEYSLIFQYVGYQQLTKNVVIENEPIILDVILQPESIGLQEVVVIADSEDPAYPIIRKAIAKKEYYLNQVQQYACDVYIKGNQKVADVPKKVMGIEIGDLGGILDTTGQGIVYLSESVSRLFYAAPDMYKEEMISSKVSGDDNGFSFNQASAMDFNFYKNTYDGLGRELISPIANNAFNYYKYRLEGTFYDESGRLINKIKVFRKRDTDPTLGGYIYIVEDLWNIYSVDMWTNGKALTISILDTIRLKQVYVPVEEPDVWQPFSKSVIFNLKIFGIKINGIFTGIFKNYNLSPNLDKQFFDNEILKVVEGANEKDTEYWEKIRPIPLSQEEKADYIKKDSLQTIWNSKEYMDSMDQKSNKFKFFDIFSGYTYTNTYKKWNVSIGSPITAISYNTVQGFNTHLGGEFRKNLDKDNNRWTKINTNINYGIADKQVRGHLGFEFNFNRIDYTRLNIEGGRSATQFNEEEPIRLVQNTTLSLLYRKNHAKLYDKYFLKPRIRSELFNGFFVDGFVEYAHRKPLFNQSDYSFFYREKRVFDSNDPLDKLNYDEPSFPEHQAVTLGLDIRIRFQQKYLSYPNRKFISGSKYPDFLIQYRRGLPIFGGDSNYDFISLALKDEIPFGIVGTSRFNIEGGMFLSDTKVPFIDFHHFNGNTLDVNFIIRYMDQFRLLEYYDYSTTKPYAKLHWEHHFQGVILGKIPLIRKFQWGLVTGANVLYSEKTKAYSEVHIGIDRIGIGLFKIFRVDFVTQLGQTLEKPRFRVLIGVDIDL